MWELARSTSHGGSSVRRIFYFVATVLLAALLWVTAISPAVHADNTASWNGDSIMYNGNQFISSGKTANKNGLQLPDGATYYTYVPQTNSDSNGKADIIYFTTGQDPGTATTANYVEYKLDMSHQPFTFSDPSAVSTISFGTPKNTSAEQASSCGIQGIGYIVCPVSNFLANGMDTIFTQLKSFVAVQPVSTDTHNDLYVAWNVMRSIANVAFIIAFLIIIYSQLTNAGVSNYGLKKLLPRLIVAAVIVNLSYYICAIAIDVSNIIGNSIQSLLMGLRESVFNNSDGSNSSGNLYSFSSVTAFVLSGGAASIAAGAGAVTAFTVTGGSALSAIFLLLPVLVGLILAVLVVLLILAARQALIVILLVLSPLAFVAYLLPNTESWFKKWRQTFMTMMIFFPGFSAVFGGAQLASALILQNASSLNVVILGLIVQVAPLAISPWLLRLSGSTLQSVAKFAQGFNKRIQSGVSNWSKPRAQAFKQDALNNPNLRWYNGARRFGRWNNYRQENVKQRGAATKGFEEYNTRRLGATRMGQRRMVRDAQNERNLTAAQTLRDTAIADLQAGSTEGLQQMRAMRGNIISGARTLNDYLNDDGTLRDRYMTKAAGINTGRFVARSMGNIIAASNRGQVAKQALANAGHVYEEQFGKEMRGNTVMQEQAGGINTHHDAGKSIALAGSINTLKKAAIENVAAADAVVASYEFNNAEEGDLAMTGRAVNRRTGEVLEGELFQQAAFGKAAKISITPVIRGTLQNSHTFSKEMQSSVKGTLDGNHSGVKATTFWAVDDTIKTAVTSGTQITNDMIMDVVRSQFVKNAVPAELMASQDPDTMKLIFDTMGQTDPSGRQITSAAEIANIKTVANRLWANEDLKSKMKEAAVIQLQNIINF